MQVPDVLERQTEKWQKEHIQALLQPLYREEGQLTPTDY